MSRFTLVSLLGKPEFQVAILSSLGSIPLHLTTLLVAILQSEAAFSIVSASFVMSSALFGLFFMSVFQAIRPFKDVSWPFLTKTVSLHVLAILLSTQVGSVQLLALLWFVIGCCSGVYMQMGTLAAAESQYKQQMFMVRLAGALIISGGIAALLSVLEPEAVYSVLCYIYVLVLVGVFLVSGRRAQKFKLSSAPALEGVSTVGQGLIGLAVLLLFFAGQSGFLAHASEFLATQTRDIGTIADSVTFAKLGVGLIMTCILALFPSGNRGIGVVGLLLLFFLVGVISDNMILLYAMLAFLLFDLAFNLAAPSILAQLSKLSTRRQKMALLSVLLAGSVLGPRGGGILMEWHSFSAVQWFAATSIAVAMAWILWSFWLEAGADRRSEQASRD